MEVLEKGKRLWMSVIIFEGFKASGLKVIKPGRLCMLVVPLGSQEADRRTEF